MVVTGGSLARRCILGDWAGLTWSKVGIALGKGELAEMLWWEETSLSSVGAVTSPTLRCSECLQSDLWLCQAQVETNWVVLLSIQCCSFWVRQGLRLLLGYMSRACVWRGGRRMFKSQWILLEAFVYYQSSEWECVTKIICFLFSWGNISALWIKGYGFNQKIAWMWVILHLKWVKDTVQQCYSTWDLWDKNLQICIFLLRAANQCARGDIQWISISGII